MHAPDSQLLRLYDDVAAIVDPVYLVGGSVRDLLMGRACDDFDFATPLAPDEVEARVRAAGRRPFLVGKRFGTVGFKVDERTVEVTTFRAETYSPHSRRPRVEYLSDLGEDLARRDFTVNAIALRRGELLDPLGGRGDIEQRVVRAVGDAGARFKEDPLRMLRAARFASQLGFEVEDATAAAIRRSAHRILSVAHERWMLELDKLLLGDAVGAGLRLLADTGLLRYLLPEIHLQVGYDQNSPWHDRPLFEHTIGVVEATPADVALRWAALLHDAGKPYARVEKPGRSTYAHHEQLSAEIVERTALYLKWSAARRDEVGDLVRRHMESGSPLRAADDAAKRSD
jgi:putative nucleotidyltransferase with HDIG domain